MAGVHIINRTNRSLRTFSQWNFSELVPFLKEGDFHGNTHTHTEIMVAIKEKGPRRNGVGFKRVSEHGQEDW
jgi:hypothetical protein